MRKYVASPYSPVCHSNFAAGLTGVNMIRKKRREKDQVEMKDKANDNAAAGTNEVGRQAEEVTPSDKDYEDDLAEALRRSKIDTQCVKKSLR